MTVASFPFLYYFLELPKVIINNAIGGSEFPAHILGHPFEQVAYLAVLCTAYLLLAGVNGGFKYVINVYNGVVSERMLRRMRYQLFAQTLRFPLSHFRRTSQGEVIAMITGEAEPIGGFVGDSLVVPAFQGGTLLTILAFMFVQDWTLGLAAISLYPIQLYLIPKLQRQVNALAKERVRTVRRLSERIGEAVSSVEEIHGNDTSEWHRADFSRWLGIIYKIRFRIYKKKFLIKFINNFLAQLTPFFFFSIGGYLVITGGLTFGALVAVLSAYKDLAAPWKELLAWYQQMEDARVKYAQLVEQFDPSGSLPEALQTPSDQPAPRLNAGIIASNVTYEDETGIRMVEGVSFAIDPGEKVALVGGSSAGVDIVAKLLARLLLPSTGSITIGGENLAQFPEWVTGRRIAYVGPSVVLNQGTIADNLFYPLKHRPLRPAVYADEALEAWRRDENEAILAGNTTSDPAAGWIDYAAIGATDEASLLDAAIPVLQAVDFEADIRRLGLRGTLDPGDARDLIESILAARAVLHRRLQQPEYQDLVEPFEAERYIDNMTVAENILFGLPIGPTFDLEHIGDHPYMRAVLDRADLTRDFLDKGLQVTRLMVDLFRDVLPGDPLFERFSFISAEALPEYTAALRRAEATGLDHLEDADRSLLMALPFQLIPARHRLGLFEPGDIARLLAARRMFAADLPADLRGAIAFFEREHYNVAASVQDNILFGKLVYGRPQSQRAVGALLDEVVDTVGLKAAIIELGLAHEVGICGVRLPAVQRQKLGLARALLKRPDILILDQAMASLEPAAQAALMRQLLDAEGGPTLICVLASGDDRSQFDRVIAMEGGRIAEITGAGAPGPSEPSNRETR